MHNLDLNWKKKVCVNIAANVQWSLFLMLFNWLISWIITLYLFASRLHEIFASDDIWRFVLLKHESQLLNSHKMSESLVAVDLNHLDLRDHNSNKEYLDIDSFLFCYFSDQNKSLKFWPSSSLTLQPETTYLADNFYSEFLTGSASWIFKDRSPCVILGCSWTCTVSHCNLFLYAIFRAVWPDVIRAAFFITSTRAKQPVAQEEAVLGS